ncbi:hypothetical protein ACWD6I_04125 [Streptomyces sp. NPDC002454]
MNDRRARLGWLAVALLTAGTATVLLLPSDQHTTPPRAKPSPSAPRPPLEIPPRCAGPNLNGLAPTVRAAWRKAVAPIHEAACAGDYRRLARHVQFEGDPGGFTTAPCAGCSSTEIVDMWRREYGFRAADLARLLETRPLVEQGGLRYQRGRNATWFARGTLDVPGQWTTFYPDCQVEPDCSGYVRRPVAP